MTTSRRGDLYTENGRQYVFVGRMRITGRYEWDLAVAHYTLGTPRDAKWPEVYFGQRYATFWYDMIDIFTNLVEVWAMTTNTGEQEG